MSGVSGLYSWQWFFLIEGIVTFLVAFSAYVLLPDWPHNTRFLTPEERDMAQYRILCSNGGKEEAAGGIWDGLRDAVKDPFTWIFCLLHFSLVTAQSFKDFFPSVSSIVPFCAGSIFILKYILLTLPRSSIPLTLVNSQHTSSKLLHMRSHLCLPMLLPGPQVGAKSRSGTSSYLSSAVRSAVQF